METTTVNGVQVTAWPSLKHLGWFTVSLCGKGRVERLDVIADDAQAALAKGVALVA